MAHSQGFSPDADELLAELDALAGLSSLEGYYATPLPALHAVALRIEPRPDDRAGRYGALRDTLEQAFDAIPDESFSYAAQALLGYSDRWRSVRDRSTDAGRAFTPAVSYDSFRRKSGRNYRENTLRAVADALIGLLAEPAAEPDLTAAAVDVDGAPAATTTVLVPGGDTSASDRATDRPRSRRKAVLVAMLIAAVAVAVVVLFTLGGSSDVATSDAPVATTPNTPTSAAALVPADEPTAPPSPPLAETSVVGFTDLDITPHCRAQHPDIIQIQAKREDEATGAWFCVALETGARTAPNMDQVCRYQYGANTTAAFDGSWTCQLATEDLHVPSSAPLNDSCPVAIGSYDRSTSRLNRYSDRFVEAVATADLPDGVCAANPMHYYGEVALGGVTQLLSRDGEPFGAVLANDPANVVVLTGRLWTTYKSLRGLQLYLLEIPGMGERVGYPAGPLRQQDGIFRLDLTSGGALVSRTELGDYVWLPVVSKLVWEQNGGANGCLGMPIGPPPTDGESPPAQQFERATVSVNSSSGFDIIPAEACET